MTVLSSLKDFLNLIFVLFLCWQMQNRDRRWKSSRKTSSRFETSNSSILETLLKTFWSWGIQGRRTSALYTPFLSSKSSWTWSAETTTTCCQCHINPSYPWFCPSYTYCVCANRKYVIFFGLSGPPMNLLPLDLVIRICCLAVKLSVGPPWGRTASRLRCLTPRASLWACLNPSPPLRLRCSP